MVVSYHRLLIVLMLDGSLIDDNIPFFDLNNRSPSCFHAFEIVNVSKSVMNLNAL